MVNNWRPLSFGDSVNPRISITAPDSDRHRLSRGGVFFLRGGVELGSLETTDGAD